MAQPLERSLTDRSGQTGHAELLAQEWALLRFRTSSVLTGSPRANSAWSLGWSSIGRSYRQLLTRNALLTAQTGPAPRDHDKLGLPQAACGWSHSAGPVVEVGTKRVEVINLSNNIKPSNIKTKLNNIL